MFFFLPPQFQCKSNSEHENCISIFQLDLDLIYCRLWTIQYTHTHKHTHVLTNWHDACVRIIWLCVKWSIGYRPQSKLIMLRNLYTHSISQIYLNIFDVIVGAAVTTTTTSVAAVVHLFQKTNRNILLLLLFCKSARTKKPNWRQNFSWIPLIFKSEWLEPKNKCLIKTFYFKHWGPFEMFSLVCLFLPAHSAFSFFFVFCFVIYFLV